MTPETWQTIPIGSMIYIAGPMRGRPEFNFPAFESATTDLRRKFYQAYSPHEYDLANGFDPTKGTLESWDAKAAFKWDLSMVIDSDAVIMLDGWNNSGGTLLEAHAAIAVGVPCYAYSTGVLIPVDIIEEAIAQKMWHAVSMVCTSSSAVTELNERGESTLQEAERLINGDRNAQYGPPTQDFDRTAAMASALFGWPFKSWHVAVFMVLLKLSRIMWSPYKRDSWVDLEGYGGCGWKCAVNEHGRESNGHVTPS